MFYSIIIQFKYKIYVQKIRQKIPVGMDQEFLQKVYLHNMKILKVKQKVLFLITHTFNTNMVA